MPQQGCQGIPVEEMQVSLQSQQASSCCQPRSWPGSIARQQIHKTLRFRADEQLDSHEVTFLLNDLLSKALSAACMINAVWDKANLLVGNQMLLTPPVVRKAMGPD